MAGCRGLGQCARHSQPSTSTFNEISYKSSPRAISKGGPLALIVGEIGHDVGKVARVRLHLFLAAETNDTQPYEKRVHNFLI